MMEKTTPGINQKYITFSMNTQVHNNKIYTTVSDRIDSALEMYYIKMGRTDYNRNKGKFKSFWDENEYNSSDVEDEIGDDAEYDDCSYLEFDDDFPMNPLIINEDNKRKEMFRILQNCYKYGTESKVQTKFSLTDNFMKS